jgi:hypothetical protein
LCIDEDISTTLPLITEDDDAKIQDTNEIRIGPITRARSKLLNQQVNSFLVGSGILLNENFILPKSLHLCLIRFEEGYGGEGEEARLQQEEEGATTENNTFLGRGRKRLQSLPRQETAYFSAAGRELALEGSGPLGSGARGGAGGVHQGEVEDQEVRPSIGAPSG